MKRLKRIVEIEYDNPYPDSDSIQDGLNWLCEKNIQIALRKVIPNSNIIVKEHFNEICTRCKKEAQLLIVVHKDDGREIPIWACMDCANNHPKEILVDAT